MKDIFKRMNISTCCPLFEMFLVKPWYCAGSDGRCNKHRTTDLTQLVQLNHCWEALQCHHHWNLRNSFWGPEETRIHVTCWNVNSLWNTVPKILSSSWLSLGNIEDLWRFELVGKTCPCPPGLWDAVRHVCFLFVGVQMLRDWDFS